MRGQGSLEYLLIVGGAIALSAIVIYTVLSLQSQGNSTDELNENAVFQECEGTCTVCLPLTDTTQEDVDACSTDCKEKAIDNEVDAGECDWDCNEARWEQEENNLVAC